MADNEREREREAPADDSADDTRRPRVKLVAQALAKHIVHVARAEALDDLGEGTPASDWSRSRCERRCRS